MWEWIFRAKYGINNVEDARATARTGKQNESYMSVLSHAVGSEQLPSTSAYSVEHDMERRVQETERGSTEQPGTAKLHTTAGRPVEIRQAELPSAVEPRQEEQGIWSRPEGVEEGVSGKGMAGERKVEIKIEVDEGDLTPVC